MWQNNTIVENCFDLAGLRHALRIYVHTKGQLCGSDVRNSGRVELLEATRRTNPKQCLHNGQGIGQKVYVLL